jgi:hypothetical protein
MNTIYDPDDAYVKLGAHIGNIVSAKNKAYGDSFGVTPYILRILYPDGISKDQYDDVLTIVRVLDKLKRIATSKNAFDENPWMDIAGYALLAVQQDGIL